LSTSSLRFYPVFHFTPLTSFLRYSNKSCSSFSNIGTSCTS